MRLTNRTTHRYKTWAYCQISTLTFNDKLKSENSLIKEVINSKWFVWQGEEYPNGVTWSITKENGEDKVFPNVKVHGYYNVDLIEPEDFEVLTKEQMLEHLIQEVKSNIDKSTEGKEYIDKLKLSIKNELAAGAQCLQLKNMDERKVSKFSVYSFFISFLVINKTEKEIKLIEFGQD